MVSPRESRRSATRFRSKALHQQPFCDDCPVSRPVKATDSSSAGRPSQKSFGRDPATARPGSCRGTSSESGDSSRTAAGETRSPDGSSHYKALLQGPVSDEPRRWHSCYAREAREGIENMHLQTIPLLKKVRAATRRHRLSAGPPAASLAKEQSGLRPQTIRTRRPSSGAAASAFAVR